MIMLRMQIRHEVASRDARICKFITICERCGFNVYSLRAFPDTLKGSLNADQLEHLIHLTHSVC
jgi:hypothetical protein